jgi:hypothetical protein
LLLGIFLVVVHFFPIAVRKDCFNCQFGFHVIAHEQTHLRLNCRDEDLVEMETWKETGKHLIQLLLSNPRTCKNCRFEYYKLVSNSTYEYNTLERTKYQRFGNEKK